MNKSTISFLDNQLENYVISQDAMKTLTGGGGTGTSGDPDNEEPAPPWWWPTSEEAGVESLGTNG